MYSIIMPAHNEAAVIHKTLTKLTADIDFDKVEVIVVCNGCQDNTAEIASSFANVKVESVAEASKPAALNRGDALASGFPRAYMDADIEVVGRELCAAMDEVGHNGVELVVPLGRHNIENASLFVSGFYAVLTSIFPSIIVGEGLYIVSKKGRSRFGRFPKIIAEDHYVKKHFQEHEYKESGACTAVVYAPRTLADLFKIRTRMSLGNMEFNQAFPHFKSNLRHFSVLRRYLWRKPWMVFAVCCYLFIQMCARAKAQQRLKSKDFTWDRDESSRKNR